MQDRTTFEVCDLSGKVLGPLRAKSRGVGLRLNGRPKTVTATLSARDPMALAVQSGAVMVKAYERNRAGVSVLRAIGRCVSFEENIEGATGTVQVNLADPYARMAQRLVGAGSPYTDGTSLAPKDGSVLLANLIAAANARGYTGVDVVSQVNSGVTSAVVAGPWAQADGVMGQVINMLGGPELELRPQEPQALGGGQVRIAAAYIAPAIGQARPSAAFEHGHGRRNVASWRRSGDLSALLNYAVSPSSSDGAGVTLTSQDTASQGTYGYAEVVVGTDVTVDSLRQSYLDEQVRLRKVPRTLVSFQPASDDPAQPGRVPRFGSPEEVSAGQADYTLGDSVPFSAVRDMVAADGKVTPTTILSGMSRVYGVDFAIDDTTGLWRPTIILTTE